MLDHVKELLQARELLAAWTGRILRARYQQSALGWLWAFVQPAAQAAIFTLIFTLFVPIQTGGTPYILFAFAATVPWSLLALSLADMSGCVVTNMALVTKIHFSRETLPVAAMLARLADFGVAFLLLGGLLIHFKAPLNLGAYLFLPAILGTQLLLILGLGFAAAAVNVFYRDVQPLLVLVVQIWFYASPVIYPISTVPARFREYYFLNPMAGLLESYRDVLLHGRPPGSYLGLAAAISLALFLLGYWIFKRLEVQFADMI